MNSMNKKIQAYCKRFPGAFVEFTGLVTPCCWLVTDKGRHDALEKFMGEDYQRIFITNSKEDIVKAYDKLEASWETDTPFETCLHVCGENNSANPLARVIRDE